MLYRCMATCFNHQVANRRLLKHIKFKFKFKIVVAIAVFIVSYFDGLRMVTE